MNEKRVFLIRNIAPEDYGGGEKYQIELARVLKNNGFSPIIFTASERLIKEARTNKIQVIRPPYFKFQNWSGWRNLLFPIFFVWQIRLKYWYKVQIKKYNPCVLNIQSRDELIGATLAAASCDKKIIWTDHADFKAWSLVNVDKRIKNQIGKWILRCAKKTNKIIMVSEYEKKWLEKIIKPRKLDNLIVVENGVMDEYKNYSKVVPKKNSFYYLGRIVEDKGVFELAKAFRKVVERIPDATLNIYGDGEDLRGCQQMLNDVKGVSFFGYTNDALGSAAKAQTFVFPSYHEGMSLALLEATMMGRRIIATNIDGNKKIVRNKETGLLVPVKSVDSLAEAMLWMLEHEKEANRMAEKARRLYEEKFNFEKIFYEKMLSLYNLEKE